jgi:hypothetical protein
MAMLAKWFSFILLLTALIGAEAQTKAASCSQNDVNNAINSASSGDTVTVPAGNCSWSGLSVAKAITLQGAGVGQTNISLNGTTTFTKQSAGVMRITGFSFSVSGGGDANKPLMINGSWLGAQPIVFANNSFNVSGSGLFRINVPGGVIFTQDKFTGGWDDSFLQIKDASDSQGSWTHADSLGNRDTNGTMNIYIEDSTFLGGSNQGIDCDDACRMVNRHNTFTNSESNSHGDDTSDYGMRHFEIYGNRFLNTRDSSQLANENQAIWIRGGTGVIYNNYFDDLAGNYWGNKAEISMQIRTASEPSQQGLSCSTLKYPIRRQIGQNYNGSNYFTDPVYVWSNTGTVGINPDFFGWGNSCGFSYSQFFASGRDYVFANPASGGNAKPGYTAYRYPHPLAGGSVSSGPNAPTGVQAVAR